MDILNKVQLLELDRLATTTDYHDVYRKYAGIGEDYLAGTFEEWMEKAKGDPVEYSCIPSSVMSSRVRIW